MSEAEKEFTQLKEAIEAGLQNTNEEYEKMMAGSSDVTKDELLKAQHEAIQYLSQVNSFLIDQVLGGLRVGTAVFKPNQNKRFN